MKKGRFGIGVIIAILLVLVSGFGTLIQFITDYLWFQELGYTSVFLKQLFTQLQLGIPFFIVIMALTYFYLRVLKKDYYKKVEITGTQLATEKTINRISLGIGVIFAFIATMATTTQLWFEILKFTNSTTFDIADPIFNLDVSFYVFKYSLLTQINQIVIGLVLAFVVLTFIYYLFLMSVRRPKMFENKPNDYADQGAMPNFGGAFGNRLSFNQDNFKEILALASRQIMILSGVFFLMVASNFFLKQYSLLYSQTGVLYGAGFTDINVSLWEYRILIALSLVSVVTVILGIKQKNTSWL